MEYINDIEGYEAFASIKPIEKGWSTDQKYHVETTEGCRLLLRVAGVAEHERKKAEYEMTSRAYRHGVLTTRPVSFGLCDGGKRVYSLLGWIDGMDAEKALPSMTAAEQYAFGQKAGAELRKIHALPAPAGALAWGVRLGRKVDERIGFYSIHPIGSEQGDRIVRHLLDRRDVLEARPQTCMHGDFGTSNLIVTPDGRAGVIDFNAFNSDHGDPWWDFDSIPWGAEPVAQYQTGMIRGYFAGEPPEDFFDVLAYYLAYDALAALCDTSRGEQGAPEDGKRHVRNVLRWFDDMRRAIPTWYLEGRLDHLPLLSAGRWRRRKKN